MIIKYIKNLLKYKILASIDLYSNLKTRIL
jgi:hypothetical protein